MSSKVAAVDVTVVFKDDDSQDTLLYTGERVVEPCNCAGINTGEECLNWSLSAALNKLTFINLIGDNVLIFTLSSPSVLYFMDI